MREVVLDTETTGLFSNAGHRIIELAAAELVNHKLTGAGWKHRFNPRRDIDPHAQKTHGVSIEDLAGEPLFGELVHDLLGFLGDSPIVAHNAHFDAGFLSAEFGRLAIPAIAPERWVCTLHLARKVRAGKRNTLKAIAADYNIVIPERHGLHSAWGDVLALARVYPILLDLDNLPQAEMPFPDAVEIIEHPGQRPHPLPPLLTEAEHLAHEEFLETLAING